MDSGGEQVVVRREALAAGTGRDQLRGALRRRQLVPLQRGVYLRGGRGASPVERARAAVLAVQLPLVVASHVTAARVHGLVVPDAMWSAGREHVTILRPERRPNRSVLAMHTARLPACDVVEVDGVPLTAVARTLVDLCRGELDRYDAVWAVERALAGGLVDLDDLEAAARRLRRTPGIVQARARFRSARPRSGSPLETRARLLLLDAGLPEPELQVPVIIDGGRRALLDMAYRRQRIGIEIDGSDGHDRVEAVFRDRWRQNDVHSEEWVLYRFTWYDVHDGKARTVRKVERALTARSHLSFEEDATGRTRRVN